MTHRDMVDVADVTRNISINFAKKLAVYVEMEQQNQQQQALVHLLVVVMPAPEANVT